MKLIRVPPCFFCASMDVGKLYQTPPIPIVFERPRWSKAGTRYKAVSGGQEKGLSLWVACRSCAELIEAEHAISLVDRSMIMFDSLGTRADEKFRITLLTAYRMFLEDRDEGHDIVRRSDASPELKAAIDQEIARMLDELALEYPGEEELDQSS